jgi:hypothetical protein
MASSVSSFEVPFKIFDLSIDEYKYWNNYKDLNPNHTYEVQYLVGKPGYIKANNNSDKSYHLKVCPEPSITNVSIHFYSHIKDLTCEISPFVKSIKINFKYEYFMDSFGKHKNKVIEDLLLLLSHLPSTLECLDLSQVITPIHINIVQYLPIGIKKYISLGLSYDNLENFPVGIEYLHIYMNYELNKEYNFNSLIHGLITLKISNADCVCCDFIDFCNLPVTLKNLYLLYYNKRIYGLPQDLEILVIDNYYYCPRKNPSITSQYEREDYINTREDIIYEKIDKYVSASDRTDMNPKILSILPDSLKVLRINCCQGFFLDKYPSTLEYLDVNGYVNLELLPLTVKGVGLYGYNLYENEPIIPEHIITIYTRDVDIKQLPAHIKRVIVIIDNTDYGNTMFVRIGDTNFEMQTYNSDKAFNF